MKNKKFFDIIYIESEIKNHFGMGSWPRGKAGNLSKISLIGKIVYAQGRYKFESHILDQIAKSLVRIQPVPP